MKDIDVRLFLQLFKDVAIIPIERGLPVQGREGDAYTLDVEVKNKQVDDYSPVRIGDNHHAGGDFFVDYEGVRAIIPSAEEMAALHLAEEVVNVLLEFADSCRLDFPCSLADVQRWGEDILDEDPSDIERRYRKLKNMTPGQGRIERRKILERIIKAMQEDDPDLSIEYMPGTKKELHEFCKMIDRKEFSIADPTFSDVIKGWLKFGSGRRNGKSGYYTRARMYRIKPHLG